MSERDQPSEEAAARGREFDRGSMKTKAIVGSLAATMCLLPFVNSYQEGVYRAGLANHIEKFPNGLIPTFGDSEALLPTLGIDAEGSVDIDLSAFIHAIDIERLNVGYDVKIADATLNTTTLTTSTYDMQASATLGAWGKEVNIPLITPPAYDVNQEVKGKALQQFFVPAEAVSGVTMNGNTAITVDPSMIEMHGSWLESPTFQQFSYDRNGDINYEKQRGWWEKYLNGVAGIQDMAGFTALKNELVAMDADSEKFIADSVLNLTTKACNNAYDEYLLESIADGYYDAAVNQFGHDPDKVKVYVEGEVKVAEHYKASELAEVEESSVAEVPTPDAKRINATIEKTWPTEDELLAGITCDDQDFQVVGGEHDVTGGDDE